MALQAVHWPPLKSASVYFWIRPPLQFALRSASVLIASRYPLPNTPSSGQPRFTRGARGRYRRAAELRAACVRRLTGGVQSFGMYAIANSIVLFVALLHVYILVLEMFLWDKPRGLRAFGLTPEFARASKALAANQGLYNGFLAAGLVWGLLLGAGGGPVRVFFLGCVFVAGLYGGLTVNRKILFIQALPAAIGLAFQSATL